VDSVEIIAGCGCCRFIGGRSAGDAGAMAQNNGKTSTVRNCTFTGNEAQFGFVAALEQNAIANTRVLDCTFTRNRGEWRRVFVLPVTIALIYLQASENVKSLICSSRLPAASWGSAKCECRWSLLRCAAGPNNGALVHQGCDTVLIQDTTFVSNTGAANLPRAEKHTGQSSHISPSCTQHTP
jgi:hypothetical protein